MRGLCNADLVQPDDEVVHIRNLRSVVIEMQEVAASMIVRCEVTVSLGGVMIGRLRLVYVLRSERGRDDEPRGQGRRGDDPSERSHPAAIMCPPAREVKQHA